MVHRIDSAVFGSIDASLRRDPSVDESSASRFSLLMQRVLRQPNSGGDALVADVKDALEPEGKNALIQGYVEGAAAVTGGSEGTMKGLASLAEVINESDLSAEQKGKMLNDVAGMMSTYETDAAGLHRRGFPSA